MEYSFLVSSIPLNVFCMLTGLEDNYEAFDMTYVLVPNSYFDMKDYDFIYDCRSDTISHRMTKDKNGIVLDFFGEKTNLIYKYVCCKNSQIISRVDIPKIEDVKFIGRYGTWDRNYKTETVIDEAVKCIGYNQ
jgi:hypothetical protein